MHKSYSVDYITGLPELEKVIVMPFVGKADEIDLSNIPSRYLWDTFIDLFISNLLIDPISGMLYTADTYKVKFF